MRTAMLTAGFLPLLGCTQPSILHFTKTSGFDHNTRAVSWAMFQSIATELAIQVDDDATGDHFTSLNDLLQYDVVVFSNTSGADLLDATQRANFEQWVNDGGNVLGIHAASDTYRHSTANGNNTGAWDFFPELIGASVQENPNHVDGTPTYTMQRVGAHPATYNVPDQWEKAEEYYYWENGYFAELNTPMLIVEETVGPNGQVNSYDAPRPMSWYRTPGNSRVVYTALGHAPSNYTDDVIFRAHVRDALAWLLEGSTGLDEPTTNTVRLFPNPADGTMSVQFDGTHPNKLLTIMDATGRIVHTQRVHAFPVLMDLHPFPPGSYTIALEGSSVRPFAIIR